MHLILVSDRLTTAKTITITPRLLMAAGLALTILVLGLSSLFSYVTVRHAAELKLPFVQDLLRSATAEDARRSTEWVQENLNAMAVKLGEMQAKLIRLDTLGERLAGAAGVKPQELKALESQLDGRGGPQVSATPLTSGELQASLDALSRALDIKTDALTLIDARIVEERIRKNLLPTSLPVETPWNASTFGWRIDPFTGQRALHEGVDFPAEVGTPIRAAAAGIVTLAERHPEYGFMVEIDHGKDLSTRYAHASRLLVADGEFVKRGQIVAEVGNTGRSTGPHLHFEVRTHGTAQNPNRFLALAKAGPQSFAKR